MVAQEVPQTAPCHPQQFWNGVWGTHLNRALALLAGWAGTHFSCWYLGVSGKRTASLKSAWTAQNNLVSKEHKTINLNKITPNK